MEWGITEPMALEYCKERGFDWGGLYEKFPRVSCWICPFQRIGALRTLYKDFPHLWEELREYQRMVDENDGWDKKEFKGKYTVWTLEEKFKKEIEKEKMNGE